MYKIAFVHSAYPDVAGAAEEFIKRTGWHIEFCGAVFDQAVKAAKNYEDKRFDLIVSRGVSGSLIKQALNIPVILIEINAFDILHSLYRAHEYGNKVGFFQFSGNRGWDFDSIKEILGFSDTDLHIYYYEHEHDLKKQIQRACTDDLDAVIATGSYVMSLIRPYGMNVSIVTTTKESIQAALKQAEDILYIRHHDRMQLEYKNALIAGAFAGCILLNNKDAVSYANEGAYDLLGLERNTTLSLPKSINDVTDSAIMTINGHRLLVRSKMLSTQGQAFRRAIYLFFPEEQKEFIPRPKEDTHSGQGTRYSFAAIVGTSKAITKVINKAKTYAAYSTSILITGESGTGKEVFAQSIHSFSARKNGPFIAINCATLPHSLLESELFGYEEGSFTGAKRGGNRGLFEVAHQGTIFLDEISEIALNDQAHLLRVLEERSIRRIGGKKTIPVNVRVIAATNVGLLEKVKTGEFRADLYYRLNILSLHLPPLRERKEDIPLLIDYFMKKEDRHVCIPDLLMEKLVSYSWPGNVRELANLVEKFSILSQQDANIFPIIEDIYSEMGFLDKKTTRTTTVDESTVQPDNSITVAIDTLKNMELKLIKCLYEKHESNRIKLASMLKISRTHLWMKLNEIYKKD